MTTYQSTPLATAAHRLLSSMALSAVLLAPLSRAASDTWSGSGADSNWSTTGNWGTAAPGITSGTFTNADIATFTATATQTTVTLDTTYNIKGLAIGGANDATQAATAAYTINSSAGSKLFFSSITGSLGSPTVGTYMSNSTSNAAFTINPQIVIQNSTGDNTGSGFYAFVQNSASGSSLNLAGGLAGAAATGNTTTVVFSGGGAGGGTIGAIADGANGGLLHVVFQNGNYNGVNGSTTWNLNTASPSFAGGVELRTSGFGGNVQFNNSQSFGTGTIAWTQQSAGNRTAILATANNLNLANALSFSSGNNGAINTNGNTLTLSGIASGSGGLEKTNQTGTLIVTGANTYTGATSISNGTLSVSSLNSVVGGSASSNLGAPTTVTNGTIAFGNGGNAGNLTYTGSGETTDRVINLAGTTGGMTMDQSGTGLLKFTSALTATGAGIKTLTLQGSTAGTGEISGAIVDNSGTNKTSVTKTGTGTWTLSGTNTYTGTTTVTTGTLKLGNTAALGTSTLSLGASGTLDLNGNAVTNAFTSNATRGTLTNTGAAVSLSATTITNNGSFTVDGTGDITLGTISGSSGNALVKNGNNTLTISNSADNAFMGMTANAGTLVLNGTAGHVANGITIAGGTVKYGTNTVSLTNGTGQINGTTINSGTLDLNGASGANATIGALSGSGGTITNSNATAATLTIGGNNAGGGTFAGVAQNGTGTLALIKTGSAAITLSGTNTFTGGTTVSAGTLATSTTGTFGAGNVTVASGALLTFGNSASFGDLATLTFAKTSTASSISLNFTGSDTVGAVFDSISSTFLTAGTYDATGLNTFFGSTVFAGTGSLTISAVPEPATYAALAGLGVLGLAVWCRRRAA